MLTLKIKELFENHGCVDEGDASQWSRCTNTVHHAQRTRSLAREIEKIGFMSVPYCNVTIAL